MVNIFYSEILRIIAESSFFRYRNSSFIFSDHFIHSTIDVFIIEYHSLVHLRNKHTVSQSTSPFWVLIVTSIPLSPHWCWSSILNILVRTAYHVLTISNSIVWCHDTKRCRKRELFSVICNMIHLSDLSTAIGSNFYFFFSGKITNNSQKHEIS